jgi:hypothetical protein
MLRRQMAANSYELENTLELKLEQTAANSRESENTGELELDQNTSAQKSIYTLIFYVKMSNGG